MSNRDWDRAKSKMESECRKLARKVGTIAPGEKNEGKLTDLLNKEVCSQAKHIDKKILTLIAKELVKVGKAHSAKPAQSAFPRVKAMGKPRAPGSGVPSVSIPLAKFLIGEKLGPVGKLDLKIWANPRDLANTEKGVMLYFTVTKW